MEAKEILPELNARCRRGGGMCAPVESEPIQPVATYYNGQLYFVAKPSDKAFLVQYTLTKQ